MGTAAARAGADIRPAHGVEVPMRQPDFHPSVSRTNGNGVSRMLCSGGVAEGVVTARPGPALFGACQGGDPEGV
jgi:hypothetical protein